MSLASAGEARWLQWISLRRVCDPDGKMKDIRVSKLLLSSAALGLAESDAERTEALELLREHGARGTEIAVWASRLVSDEWWGSLLATTASIPANDRTAARLGHAGAVSIGVAKEDL